LSRNVVGILIMIALNLQVIWDSFSNMNYLISSSVDILHLFVDYFISQEYFKVSVVQVFNFLRLIPKYVLFLMLLFMILFSYFSF
jgi:hypothetical protein